MVENSRDGMHQVDLHTSRYVFASTSLLERAEALAEAHRRKDRFLATRAHELRRESVALAAVIDAERRGDDVVVRVEDNGTGIAAGDLPRLFAMFSQVGSTAGQAQQGLGIGLSLVKGLVERHGGAVTAHSDGLGRGSLFTVRLPVGQMPARDAKAHAQAGAAPQGPKLRILVADDRPDTADSLTMMLGILGHDVRTAYDGQRAVEIAAAHRPDVVLLDIGMPGLNGYEAARRIRAQPWGQAATLIALTGWGQEDDRRRSAAAGFDHHLVKPADIGALMQLLSSCGTGARPR